MHIKGGRSPHDWAVNHSHSSQRGDERASYYCNVPSSYEKFTINSFWMILWGDIEFSPCAVQNVMKPRALHLLGGSAKVLLLAYILYMCCVHVCECMHVSQWEGARRRKTVCVFVCKCSISGSTLAPSQCVQTLRLRTLRGHKWHEAKITPSYLQHVRHHAVIHQCCHCVTFQAFKRIYNFGPCAKK